MINFCKELHFDEIFRSLNITLATKYSLLSFAGEEQHHTVNSFLATASADLCSIGPKDTEFYLIDSIRLINSNPGVSVRIFIL